MTYLLKEYVKFKKEYHKLSGIALMVDNKICLVLPKKFKKKKKYSIPKGHVESVYNDYHNAYLELREETGIDIGIKAPDYMFNYNYKKNGVVKRMVVFVVKMTKDEFESLKKYKRNKKEIYDVRFVKKSKALDLVENKFKKLIKYLYK